MNDKKLQELACAVIDTEARAISGLTAQVNKPSFTQACQLMLECKGRVVVIDSEVLTRDYPIMFILILLMFVMAYGFRGPGRINRLEGAIMVAAYAGYQTLLYFSTTG